MKKVSIEKQRYILNDFFKVEEAYLQYERFDGEMSPLLRRLSLERGNSVAVLIFNEDTNKLILCSQFRYPTYKKGHGWMTEVIAGVVESNEPPEETARRELEEEIGLKVDTLEHITAFYPSPGGSSELIHLFYSRVSGKNARYKETGGLIGEGEDIKAVELTLEDALAKIKSGEIVDAKTIISIYWLENHRLKK